MTLTATMPRRLRVASLAVLVAVGLVSAPAAMGRPALPSVRGLDRVLEANHPDRIPGSFIVKVAPGLDASRVARAISADYGGRITDTYSNVLGGFAIEGPDTLGGSLATDPRILLVEADRKVKTADLIVGKTTAGVRRTYSNRPGGSVDSAREVDCTPGVKCGGTGVVGAIIDSGVDLDHQEFDTPGKFFDMDPSDSDIDTAYCSRSGLKVGPRVADANGHGTRGAGNFAARGVVIEGVAPKARIAAIRARLTVAKVICAMDFVTAFNLANPSLAVRLVNMSLAWGDTNAFSEPCSSNASHQAVCNLALSHPLGVFITVAAGNSNKDARHTAPAGYGQVFTLSAMCDRPPEGDPGSLDGLANFSNFGAVVDAIGPGCKVRSPEGSGTGYTTSSGTSRAAPHAMGIGALLLQDNPTLAAAQLGSIIRRTGQCRNLQQAGVDETCVGQGDWPRVRYSDYKVVGTDPDGIPEPSLHAFNAVCEADVPPAC